LDKFGIDLKIMAKEMRSTKACSTSVQDGKTGPQVLAQGNHTAFVYKLLKGKTFHVKLLDNKFYILT